jgi:hypothetical protein
MDGGGVAGGEVEPNYSQGYGLLGELVGLAGVDRQDVAALTGASSDFGTSAFGVGLGLTLWTDEERQDRIWLSADAEYRNLDGIIDLPLSGIRMPDTVYDLSLSIGGAFQLNESWRAVAQIGVRSRSDKPFSSDSVDVEFEGYARYGGKRHGLLLGLNWGFRNRLLAGGPLPILAWHYTPKPNLTFVVGFPVASVVWRPGDWMVRALVLPGVYDASVTWAPWRSVEGATWQRGLSFGAVLSSGGFRTLLDGRADDDYEFQYGDQRLGLVVGFGLGPNRRMSIQGGYAFNRSLSDGETSNLFEDDEVEATWDVDGGAYASAAIRWTF